MEKRFSNKMKLNSRDIVKEFKLKQRDFERKIEFSNNNDLNLWYQHITYVNENSEIVDKEQKLLTVLIEKCIEKFVNNPKYVNDEKFYSIFYKYTQITSDPDEVYKSIDSLKIFNKLSKFYISWSWVLMNMFENEKALKILDLGLENKAQPISLLIQAKEELLKKIEEDKNSDKDNKDTFILKDKKSFGEDISGNNFLSKNKSIKIKSKDIIPVQSLKRKPFEILEEDSDENRTDSSNQSIKKQESPKQIENDFIEVKKNTEKKSNKEPLKLVSEKTLTKKFKTTDDFKEPKIVIFENLKPNQKFYADLNRMYLDNTEYSFEEIRMKKIKKDKKNKGNQTNIELIKEIEYLKNELKKKEEKYKEQESLQTQVDALKKQIEILIAHSLTQNSKRAFDEVDRENLNEVKKPKLSEQNKLCIKKDENELTIVRDMWNGTFASQTSPNIYECKDLKNNQKKDFSIFRDPTQTNFRTTDFSIYPQLSTTANQDCFTIALPRDPSEFEAKLASTPAIHKRRF